MIVQTLSTSEIIKIELENHTLQIYLMPDGEQRMGLDSLSLLLEINHATLKNFIRQKKQDCVSIKIAPMNAKEKEPIVVETLSIQDVVQTIIYEAITQNNTKAIQAMAFFVQNGIESFIRQQAVPTISDMIDNLMIIQSKNPIEIEILERSDRPNPLLDLA